MSSSPDFSETGRFLGRKLGKAPEKSNFAQTCNLLSQYLKEKGALGDLSLGMTRNLEGKGNSETFRQTTTMNLLPSMETSGEVSVRNVSASGNINSMDLFPQCAGIASSVSMEDVPKKTEFSIISKPATTEPENAQMTIFYAGQVLVFNDLPANKAKEIMLLASKGSSKNPGSSASSSGNDQINSGSFAASGSNFIPISGNNLTQERPQKPPQPITSDLPIARKASLHRFLEKRKDRISARAPYQVNNTTAPPTSKPDEKKAWLGLAA
ncbi:hypothetical protein HHK36_014421 [Tetracentron sinense]|uniref:Protein TIFY n=1 Tax=Tetracentron sinense TaxID=13715 RepID=A0A835DHQ3_TETSI|nr:hypothetical protein HHK36_014421 [Tetracentron sinense]